MKARLIYINWCLGFFGLFIDTEFSPLWAVAVGFVWFIIASILLIYADKKGWMDDLVKRNKFKE